jgi:Uma2 family endonuclease
MRVSSKRVRIPDVCVMLHGQPREEVIETPPFLCIEVLSPDDSLSSMMDRVHDYLAFGIPHIWLIDPYRERCYFATADGLIEAHDNILRTSNPEIVIPAFELFAKLAE